MTVFLFHSSEKNKVCNNCTDFKYKKKSPKHPRSDKSPMAKRKFSKSGSPGCLGSVPIVAKLG